jgi:hypothetical protein
MSDDSRRLPLKAEVDVFIGSVFAELSTLTPATLSFPGSEENSRSRNAGQFANAEQAIAEARRKNNQNTNIHEKIPD